MCIDLILNETSHIRKLENVLEQQEEEQDEVERVKKDDAGEEEG